MSIQELVINYHMTEMCNFSCKYCFATWGKTFPEVEIHQSSNKVEQLINLIANYFLTDNPIRRQLDYKTVRINFAGGEPVMLGSRFINAISMAKEYGLNTSLITNGYLLTNRMISKISPYLDMLGISFDTSDPLTAECIGRVDRKKNWLSSHRLEEIIAQYRQSNCHGKVKINTVVNVFNRQENLTQIITKIAPNKWKLLRVLPVYSKNLSIKQEQYLSYVQRHQSLSNLIITEDNEDMWQSYLMLNPEGKFYQNIGLCAGIKQSPSIFDVGIKEALSYIDFNPQSFVKRYIKV